MFYEPSKGHGLPHDPFKAIVAPRPIGWISTVDQHGCHNLAPYSFYNAICSSPPMVMFSSEGMKDSAANAKASGEFVCNFASMALIDAMNATSAPVAPAIDEFELAALASAPSLMVRPRRVASAPAALECRVIEVVSLRDLEGRETDRHLVMGQVVGIYIDDSYLRDGHFDTARASPVARCGYLDYAVVNSVFPLQRPG